jgi:hypothetical protein
MKVVNHDHIRFNCSRSTDRRNGIRPSSEKIDKAIFTICKKANPPLAIKQIHFFEKSGNRTVTDSISWFYAVKAS